MNKTRNILARNIRKEAIAVLNHTVADLFDLFARIKKAHWNVHGTTFISLHKLLDEFSATIMTHIIGNAFNHRDPIKNRKSSWISTLMDGARTGAVNRESSDRI